MCSITHNDLALTGKLSSVTEECPFCSLAVELTYESELVVGFRDKYPVSHGHTLLIPRRHVGTWFEATDDEQAALMDGVAEVQRELETSLSPSPDGYNVGFNSGEAAGQTVMHLHVHVIPRYRGDMHDPRGGVRGVIPWKQKYGSVDAFDALPDLIPGEEEAFAPALRDALRLSSRVRMLSAFVQPSGLRELRDEIIDALQRGAQIELLTGDYLNVTSPDALRELLAWSDEHERFNPRFYRCPDAISFHAKAYIFEGESGGIAYVGSSNISAMALTSGVEWNLRALSSSHAAAFERAKERFDALFWHKRSVEISRELIDQYEELVRVPPGPEAREKRPEPHGVQDEALEALRASRREGARRGMVVMATGLGKTYLSAFDFDQLSGKRALFIAHRAEILKQAKRTWAKLFPDRYVGLLKGGKKDFDADILCASVQALAKPDTLKKFAPDHFDYIVVDEFHHAAAKTYRRVLHHFTPRFLLGLTATPDRMDGASLLSLCDENLVFRAGVVRGVTDGLLVPFHYYGVADKTDFAPIPWRSGKFDPSALAAAVETRDRAEQALAAYREHAPNETRRALVFCCSVSHADYTAEYFRSEGIKAVAVHSEKSSAPRAKSLADFAAGDLEMLCVVDLFNEGLDVPDINVVLMLRPTESPIIFLQQLGRGLRLGKTIEKPFLTIIDFIGNHRAFLVKPQALVALTGTDLPPHAAIRVLGSGEAELPPGCKVEIDVAAIEMLEQVARASREDTLIYEYTTLRDGHGRRPTAGEVFAAGVHMKPVKERYGTWFDFVDSQGDLTTKAKRVLNRHRKWFTDLTKTKMTKSFKMVALWAMSELDSVRTSLGADEIADEARKLLLHDAAFRVEAPESAQAGGKAFRDAWLEYPLKVWASGKGTNRKWFKLDEGRFEPSFTVEDEDAETFDAMTDELVDLRLREHRSRLAKREVVSNHGAPIVMRVSHSSGKPILRFDRKRYVEVPEGDVDVFVGADRYTFRFKKIAVNVVVEVKGGANVLPRIMREIFGPRAGLPGSRHFVELWKDQRGWRLDRQEPDVAKEATILPFPALRYYPELAVACGIAVEQDDNPDGSMPIQIETDVDAQKHFVVRASGESMNGGDAPIEDGDLVLIETASVTDPAQFEGKPCLLSGYEGPDQSFAQIKIPLRQGKNWILRSTNPEFEDQTVAKGVKLHVAGMVVGTVKEPSGVTLWGTYDRPEVVAMFGQHYGPSWKVGHRNFDVNGKPNTFLFVTLRKPPSTKLEHRYADRFLSRREFQWESQASTTPKSKKGRSVIDHKAEKRAVHLFVRPEEKVKFVYCGKVAYKRHTGSKPIRVWFELENELPLDLYRRWAT